jgi:arylsulfatase A-like enzyme
LSAADRPNFVFILADDLGWSDLGCYGSSFHETPHIDRLASEGMRFTQAYTAGAVCSPTRGSIMTGKYPVRTGVTDYIPQGNRVLNTGKTGDKLFKGGFVPAAELAFDAKASFQGSVSLQHIQC